MLRSRLRAHIRAVVGRYRGHIHGWDVVNEALDEGGSLRRTPWLEAIGDHLTELDIDVLPGDPDMWGAHLSKKATIHAATNVYPDGLPDERQQLASRHAEIFKVVLRHRQAVSRVTFWGVTGAQSWPHDFPIPGRVN